MSMKLKLALLCASLPAIFAPAQAQNVEAGKRLAQTWCSSCHAISAEQKRGTVFDVAPSYVSIANMKSTTAISLRVFLGTPHANMPNYSLSRQEIRDVSAYILSLKKKP